MQDGGAWCVADVAVGADHFVIVMGATMPANADARVVATQTHTVLCLDRRFFIRSKFDNRWALLPAPDPRRVPAAGAVAGLTLKLPVAEWTTWIGRYCVGRAKHCQGYCIIMAGDAAVSTLPAVNSVRASITT